MRAGALGTLVSALAILSLQAGDFSKTCTDISVSEGGQLGAVCRTRDNRPHTTSINLNENIANIDGDLQIVGSSGNFAESCTDLNIRDRSVLSAQCRRINGQYKDTSIDLDKYIENVDGDLEWEITVSLPVRKVLRNYVKNVMEMEESGSSLPHEQPALNNNINEVVVLERGA